MCDICSVIYHSDTKHDITVCPVRSALFCSVCQTQGHSTMKCPDKVVWQTRVPEYIEQLIPLNLRNHHNIKSQTPIQLPNMSPLESRYIPVIEVPVDTNGTHIRATLASYNLPSSSIKENKRVLEAFGSLIGKKVVYLQSKYVPPEKPKKVIKTKKTTTAVTETT